MATLTKASISKMAQDTLAQTRQSKLVKNLEKKLEKSLPFEMTEEALKEIVNNILVRAREIRQGLKTDPVATVKNYKSLLDLNSLAVVKKKKKSSKATTPKKALKKAAKKTAKKAIH